MGCAAATGAHAVSIELKDVAADRIERQRAAAQGELPLPGTPAIGKAAERLRELGVAPGSAILIRIFKAQSELELWVRRDDSYVLFATYPVCHWSGGLGPKLREGDKRTPEGFYTVTRRQLHHVGRWPRSLNLGFPNAFDKSQNRTGSYILIHGGCSSVGCFAMTNPVVEEIYKLALAAVRGGQTHIPVHVFPFRMTDANLAAEKKSPWHGFWTNLKEGYDAFERTHRPPQVSVCDNRYQFQELPAAEVADSGPLAVCGATIAAIRGLTASRKYARPVSLLAKAGLPLPIIPALTPGGPDHPETLETATATFAPRPVCSVQRASCRKFLSLRKRRLANGAQRSKPASSSKRRVSSKRAALSRNGGTPKHERYREARR